MAGSTVAAVISKRLAKHQQMQWTRREALATYRLLDNNVIIDNVVAETALYRREE